MPRKSRNGNNRTKASQDFSSLRKNLSVPFDCLERNQGRKIKGDQGRELPKSFGGRTTKIYFGNRIAKSMNQTNEPPINDGSLGDTEILPFQYAKKLLSLGFYVFPLAHLSKIPLKGWAWKDRASNDPQEIEMFEVLYKWSNVGISCEPSNLVVIDLDKFKGQEIAEKYRLEGVTDASDILCVELEKVGRSFPTNTYSVQTPSGGRHLYYRNEGEPIKSGTSVNGMTGIDIRGVGGYVVAEGSRSEKGLYVGLEPSEIQPLPDHLREIITVKKPKTLTQGFSFVAPTSIQGDLYRFSGIRNEIEKVRKAQEGTRNSTLFASSCAVGELVADDLSLLDDAVRGLVEAGIAVGLTQYESETTTERGIREGLKTPRSRKNVTRTNDPELKDRSFREG
jgi:hypothetical protein